MLHFGSTNVNNLSAAEVRQIFLKMFFCVFPSAKLSWTHILTLSPLLHNVVCITSSSIGLSMQLNKTCDLGDARAKPTSWVSAITARIHTYWGKQGRASWNGSAVLRFSSNLLCWGWGHSCCSCHSMTFWLSCLVWSQNVKVVNYWFASI